MEVKIEWFEKQTFRYGKFTFKDTFKDTLIDAIINDWTELFSRDPTQKYTLIWDCTNLVDYESIFGPIFQRAFRKTQYQIDRILIMSNFTAAKPDEHIRSFFLDSHFEIISLGGGIFEMRECILSGSTQLN